MNILVKNICVVGEAIEYEQDILIQNGIIEGISPDIHMNDIEIIDGSNAFAMPGLIDMHCKLGEPGYEFNETIESGTLSAAKGGFTGITYNPDVKPVIDNKTVIEFILSKAKSDGLIDIYPYGSMTKQCKGSEISELKEMCLSGAVGISDGDLAIQDSQLMANIFKYSQMLDCPLITHCEDIGLSLSKGINDGFVATILGLQGAISAAEEVMLSRNLILASKYNVHLHIPHVSTKGSVALIREAKRQGVRVTAETSPQYFILTENMLYGYNTFGKVNPPLRRQEDVDGVLEGIADGTIDVISSDHQPTTLDSKQVEFEIGSFGISSFETAFSLAYTHLVYNNLISLERLVQMMSTMPAKILKLNHKGHIALGQPAEFVIVEKGEFVITGKNFASKAKFTPFEGFATHCDIRHVFTHGKKVI